MVSQQALNAANGSLSLSRLDRKTRLYLEKWKKQFLWKTLSSPACNLWISRKWTTGRFQFQFWVSILLLKFFYLAYTRRPWHTQALTHTGPDTAYKSLWEKMKCVQNIWPKSMFPLFQCMDLIKKYRTTLIHWIENHHNKPLHKWFCQDIYLNNNSEGTLFAFFGIWWSCSDDHSG